MIYAKNADALAYRGIHPNLDLALEHITPEFLAALRDNQRVELKGDLVYCTRFTYETIPQEESFFEAHRRYLDIHIMVEGEERVDMLQEPASWYASYMEQYQAERSAWVDRAGSLSSGLTALQQQNRETLWQERRKGSE